MDGMAKKPEVVNLIPTYNEKENILAMLQALERIRRQMRRYRLVTLVVDDRSPDGTAEVVKRYQARHRSVFLLLGDKTGLGEAMIRGLKYAMHRLHADFVIPNEADFAFDPKHIPLMLKKMERGYDVVVASRHVGDGRTEGWTRARRLNHWIANQLFATWIAGTTEVYDHNGAFKAIRVKGVLNKIDLEVFPTVGFGFFNYLIFRLSRVTTKFCEFPVTYRFRTSGESKISFNPKYLKTYIRDVVEYIRLACLIRWERTFSRQGGEF